MKPLLILVVISLAAIAAAVLTPAPSDLLLLAVPCAIASLILLLRAALRKPPIGPQKSLILDGSNVMHWRDGKPSIDTVWEVVTRLKSQGNRCGVMFDANAGYLLADRYQHDGVLARQLRLPKDRVMVAPKGTPADPMILQAARDMGAKVVTNDRFRDWADQFPEVAEPGFLIKGGYRDGALWLDLDDAEQSAERRTA